MNTLTYLGIYTWDDKPLSNTTRSWPVVSLPPPFPIMDEANDEGTSRTLEANRLETCDEKPYSVVEGPLRFDISNLPPAPEGAPTNSPRDDLAMKFLILICTHSGICVDQRRSGPREGEKHEYTL